MRVEPYLFFDGNCEEAAKFYQRAIGAEVTALMRFNESPQPLPSGTVPPAYQEKVMHMTLKIGESRVMAADDCTGHPTFNGIQLSLRADDEAEAERLFAALGEAGTVRLPLAPTAFARCFGTLTDRYGVGWTVTTAT